MKLYDQSTQDLVRTVQDVLEGKAPLQEMDPAKHVVQDKDTGMFCVYNTAGKKLKEFKDKADAVKYATDNHDELMKKENVAGPADLSVDQNVKKVQAKHGAVKKIDLTVEENETLHDEALAIHEARQLKDPKTEVLVVKNGKVEVINKKDIKSFMAKGYELAEDDDQGIEEAKSLNRPQTDAEKKVA